jgi:hypothetical protein
MANPKRNKDFWFRELARELPGCKICGYRGVLINGYCERHWRERAKRIAEEKNGRSTVNL